MLPQLVNSKKLSCWCTGKLEGIAWRVEVDINMNLQGDGEGRGNSGWKSIQGAIIGPMTTGPSAQEQYDSTQMK